MTPVLRFLGACGTVTGSRFLIERDGDRLLVDCGLFQGTREQRRRNWAPPGVEPTSVTAAVITHAHLDHSGYLPAFVRDGFSGPILATPSTCELIGVVLRDSAHLQEEDADYAAQHRFSKHSRPVPLYDSEDAEKALTLLRPLPFGEPAQVAGMDVTLDIAGHILGSAIARVTAAGRTVVFSGDLGRQDHPLLRPPAPRPDGDVVVVESTYGDRRHPGDESVRLGKIITDTLLHRGSVLIPAFAVDRTEVVLHALLGLRQNGAIPDVPIFVDSPMALTTLRIYRDAFAAHAADVRPEVGADPFGIEGLHLAATVPESMALNHPEQPCIIVSASGMASGGRVVHHLAHMLPEHRNTVLLVGYQAVGTRGYDIAHGAAAVKALGRYIPVRARIEQLESLSVHADTDELMGWLASGARAPDSCYVVHGEPDASAALAQRIRSELGWLSVAPHDGETVRLD
ncbi:MAG: MBL fold metallo-hydrolase RNA specificity domain-containing protein [Actinomycetes bacterium]